jgi:hypothetical protein
MTGQPQPLAQERQRLEAAIREAFRGVDRRGGISWGEADVIDSYGSDEERAAARAKDTEPSWESLVDNPAWVHEWGWSYTFLDAIGYRYYMPPAMIRCSREGHGESVCYALTMNNDYMLEKTRRLSQEQCRVIARFVRFMIRVHEARDDDIYGAIWKAAYDSHWHQWPADA